MIARRRFLLAFLSIVTILLFLSPTVFLFASASKANSGYVSRAEGFLVSQYNGKIGLLSEYPGSSTYWLYSDNYLALLAFKHGYSLDRSYQRTVEKNVNRTLQGYLSRIPDDLNQYMVLTKPVFYFNGSQNYIVSSIGGSVINTTVNNKTGYLDPHNYADIAFLEAIYYDHVRDKAKALTLFQIGAKMYNGIGLNDSVCGNPCQYQTYKLALYLYASKILGQRVPSSVRSTLLSMQNQTTGGFYSGYVANYSTDGTHQNVETTALAILALTAG